jgi:hypothetical protein
MTALQPFGPDIWIAEGPVVSFFGFPYPTRMAAIRLANRDLFVWSPVALTSELKSEMDSLGRVAHLVSPNKIHHLYMREWKVAYPQAQLYASPGLVRRIKDLRFDTVLDDGPDPAWAADIDQVRMSGSFALTEIVFFHRKSRTAIFADLIQNFPPGWFKGWRGFVARLDGITASDPGAPREWRFSFRNRKAARKALARILAWQPEQLVIAHGDMVRQDGTAFIRKAFRWLAH